jgi:hypothetical protein
VRLRWAGHVTKLSDSEIPTTIMNYNPEGKTRIARPNIRWNGVNNMRKEGV